MAEWRNKGTGEVKQSSSNPGNVYGTTNIAPGAYNNGTNMNVWEQVPETSQPGYQYNPNDQFDPAVAGARLGHELARRRAMRTPSQKLAARKRTEAIFLALVIVVVLLLLFRVSFVTSLVVAVIAGIAYFFLKDRARKTT